MAWTARVFRDSIWSNTAPGDTTKLWMDTSTTPWTPKEYNGSAWVAATGEEQIDAEFLNAFQASVVSTQTSVEANLPSSTEKSALAGTTGTPGSANRYVTDTDTRNTNARTPTTHTHAAADVTSGTLTTSRIGSGTPLAGMYVDGATGAWTTLPSGSVSLFWKNAARAATTANITLSGTQTIDDVVLVAGNRVLVKNQTTGSDNGIYVVAAGAWTRATDADTSGEVPPGTAIAVTEGTANHDTVWLLTNDTVTLGTTALTFVQLGVSTNPTATQVSNAPAGNIIATNVQAAINELDTEKSAVGHAHAGTDITSATIDVARIGTGTKDATTFYRGDGTFAPVGASSGSANWKDAVVAATTTNITLSGTQTIDGVAVIVGDRVLVKNQTTQSQNGIYVVAGGAWGRSSDASTSGLVPPNMVVGVSAGTANAESVWMLTTDAPITLGTTALTFVRPATTPTAHASSHATGGSDAVGGLAPVGGTTGQILKKVSSTNYDYSWQAESGGGSGGVAVLNVKTTYGASGGGFAGNPTADQTAFTNAIAAANAATDGAVVYAPAGVYILTGGFTVGPKVRIMGDGPARTFITNTANSILFSFTTANDQYVPHIHDIYFYSDSVGSATRVIYDRGVNHLLVERCHFTGATGGSHVELSNDVAGLWTENVTFRDCKSYNALSHVRLIKGAGDKSMSGLSFERCQMNLNTASSIGIDAQAGVQVYAANWDIKFMNERQTVTSIKMGASTAIEYTHFNILIEGWTTTEATAGTAVQTGTSSVLNGTGRISLYSAANTLNHNVTAGGQFFLNGNDVTGLTGRGDTDVTLIAGADSQSELFNTTLTANRTVTLSTDKVFPSARFHIRRTAAGNFGLNIGPGLVTLSRDQWAEVESADGIWYLRASGPMAPTGLFSSPSDVTNSTATLADVTGLTAPLTSGVASRFRATVFYDAQATATGSRWTVNVTGGTPTSIRYTSRYGLTSTTETVNYANAVQLPAAANASSPFTTGNVAVIEGGVVPSANGALSVQFASEAPGTNNTITAKAGSTLQVF